MRAPLAAFAVALLLARSGAALSADEVPAPPPGRWSVDLTGTLTPATLAELDRLAGELDRSGHGQLGVAVIDTTSGRDPRDFATELFNRWGIGDAARNDGVLLFAALEDRAAEIILGDGLGEVSTDSTDRIMRESVVASFRRGDPDRAVLEGARELCELLAGAAAQRVPPEELPDDVRRVGEIAAGRAPLPSRAPRGWVVDLSGALPVEAMARVDRLGDEVYASGRGRVHVVVFRARGLGLSADALLAPARSAYGGGVYLVLAATDTQAALVAAPPEVEADPLGSQELSQLRANLESGLAGEPVEAVVSATEALARLALHGPPPRPMGVAVERWLERHGGRVWASLGGLLVGGAVALRHWLRRRPRRCQRCGHPRQLLDEQWDDVHLSEGQKAEERVRSVDYDVWHCGRCEDVLVLRYGAWLSRHGSCAACGFRTAKSTSRTLVHATYQHGGKVEVTERCAHCGHVRSFVRHTARLQRSSSWSSSSRSSGSSFGGGRSSGRGSSGRW